MTTATTTPITTAVSTDVEGSVGAVGERHTHGTHRLTDTCKQHRHTSTFTDEGIYAAGSD